jgi:hypothetical protein
MYFLHYYSRPSTILKSRAELALRFCRRANSADRRRASHSSSAQRLTGTTLDGTIGGLPTSRSQRRGHGDTQDGGYPHWTDHSRPAGSALGMPSQAPTIAVSPRSTRGTGGHPGPPETSQNLPSRSPHPQSPLHPGHRQTRPLQVPGARSATWTQITWSCAQGKCAPVNASAISRSIQKKPARSTPLTTSAFTTTNPISSR